MTNNWVGAEKITMPFSDAPGMEQVEAAISGWQRPELPKSLKNALATEGKGIGGLARLVRGSLSGIQSSRSRKQLEVKVISWLYDFIRANVKRGRVFDLGEVLRQCSADCLGYAKLLCYLGERFTLDIGIVEVIIDNGAR